ncbi:glycosyltransferase family 4 protein [Bombella apis]|uniref:glycosyltransferase family 4 protein n=1 Tax=Bombella apis TaxID=1785988 RepID=UPI0024A8C793|nr:glycosyltransferase family 1 protein [Bombella apis]
MKNRNLVSLPSSNPKIWLDGRNISRHNGTGIYYYALNHQKILTENGFNVKWLLENTQDTPLRSGIYRFVRALASLAPHIHEESFQSPWGTAHLASDLYRVAHVHFRYHKKIFILKSSIAPDIMHWTYPLPVLIEGCKNIVTIHDIIPLTHPHLTNINAHNFRSLLQNLIDHDVHFITVSETVRQQIINTFTIEEDRITTLYQPVDFNRETLQDIKKAPQIAPPNSFIFYGRMEHRKNIERLLEAHARTKTKTPLVLIGPKGDDQPNCSSPSPDSRVIHLPWSQRSSLLRTLAEAKALLFPSLAEGFGVPIIEAMALGIPVLTSQGGATEEIAGGAALLCNPLSIDSIAEKITQLDKASPSEISEIRTQGYQVSNSFNSPSYQKRYIKFIEEITTSK